LGIQCQARSWHQNPDLFSAVIFREAETHPFFLSLRAFSQKKPGARLEDKSRILEICPASALHPAGAPPAHLKRGITRF
jgi:hypothetical protein